MKAFIEKHKPAAVDLVKNFGYGLASIIAFGLALVVFAAIARTTTGTVLIISQFAEYVILAIAFTTIGKFVRTKLGK